MTRTVVVADDQASMRLLASAALAGAGVQVLQAADGDQAWALIQQHHPAVALLDVQMPGRNGLELTQAVRSDPNLAATRVILLTASAMKADVDAGLAAGADAYLTKPFSPLKLRTEVERLLSGG